MKLWKTGLPLAAALLFAGPSIAQSPEEAAALEMVEREAAEYKVRLQDAEERMAAAARLIAEISSERMPQMRQFGRGFEFSNKPRIGVTIDGAGEEGAVDGVKIAAVTPGSAADDAGLRSGDVITAVNSEAMGAASSDAANKRLLDFMHGVEEGDELNVDYVRDGKKRSIDVTPRVMQIQAFAWAPGGGQQIGIDKLHGMVGAPQFVQELPMDFRFPWAGSRLGRMELVELSKGLGKYFGTDSGLLVVSAPEGDDIKLQDGDVIQSIGGREPKDAHHAMRILSSYQSGETLKLGIMRDKKKRTIEIEIPAHHSSSLLRLVPRPVQPARAVDPQRAAATVTST